QSPRLQAFLWQSTLIIMVLSIWQLVTIVYAPDYLPGMLEIGKSWLFHWTQGTLLSDLTATLTRVSISFFLAMFIGMLIGIALGTFQTTNVLLQPFLLFFLNLPALVTIILCYIWIGLEESAAILAVFINKLPMVIVAVREGTRVIDSKLMEVAKVYNVHRMRTFFSIYLPQLYPFILAAARNGLALIWKIVLVVELLGRSDGIGFGLHNLFQFFDIAGILAYAFSFMVIMFLVDFLIFKPLERKIQRGRDDVRI
ncbi:MAG: ABC transporter permease subunit, partial [Pseudomonadota bacterium]